MLERKKKTEYFELCWPMKEMITMCKIQSFNDQLFDKAEDDQARKQVNEYDKQGER